MRLGVYISLVLSKRFVADSNGGISDTVKNCRALNPHSAFVSNVAKPLCVWKIYLPKC